MRKQTEKDLYIVRSEKDFLEGNINRMCVTDDLEELIHMKEYALNRIEHIYQVNYERLTEED